MRRAAVLALLTSFLVASPPAGAAEPTGRLLVSLEEAGMRATAAAPAVLARAAARRAGPSAPQIGLVTVRPAGGTSLRDLAVRLRADPRVRAVQVERRARPRFVPNDPALGDAETAAGTPPGTVVQWWAQRTGLYEAWDVVRGANATVAIIDSGVDGDHPELRGKIRSAIDATGRGYDPLVDEAGHGTHVASTACGAAGNGIGTAGAGLDCGVVAAKTDFADASVASAIVQAADRGVQVINLSFGTDGGRAAPTAISDALRYAAARGAVLVAAAADDPVDEQGDPANILQPTGTGPDLALGLGLTVTAATFADERAWFAGRGSQISLAAYGTFARGGGPSGLLAAWPATITSFELGEFGPPPLPPCGCRTAYRGDARYAYLQGTSMATAIVSGVAALVRELNPDLTPAEVVRLLKETARRPEGSSWSPELGWGIVDARAAVTRARQIDRRPPVSRVRGPRRIRGASATLFLRGSDDGPRAVTASGIDFYEIWRSSYGRRPVRIATTSRSRYRIRARRGGRYAFFTVATDRQGNREEPPSRPDLTLRRRR